MSLLVAFHDAFRRDPGHLARTASRRPAELDDPARHTAVQAGWELFKTQLHIHHTGEDHDLWPRMRTHLANHPDELALLQAMQDEHARIDPLLDAVEGAFADRDGGHQRAVGIESSVTSVSWLPLGAVQALPELAFASGLAHYDPPPLDQLHDPADLLARDGARFVNRLRAFIEVQEGRITAHGHLGQGHIGSTTLRLGSAGVSFPGAAFLDLRPPPQAGDTLHLTAWASGLPLVAARRGGAAGRRGSPGWPWHPGLGGRQRHGPPNPPHPDRH